MRNGRDERARTSGARDEERQRVIRADRAFPCRRVGWGFGFEDCESLRHTRAHRLTLGGLLDTERAVKVRQGSSTVRHSAEVRPVGFVINFLAVSYLL